MEASDLKKAKDYIRRGDVLRDISVGNWNMMMRFPKEYEAWLGKAIQLFGRVVERAPAYDVVPTPKWIPVSERLPYKDGRYLVFKSAIAQGITSASFTHDLESIADYDFKGENRPGFFYYDSEYGYCEMLHITHWMPLPEPPKDGE